MSLKAELETWARALKAYEEEDYDASLETFQTIADSSKILFNMAIINATLGEHAVAVELFNAATSLDQYLAVAYHQAGVSNFLLGRFEFAMRDFEEALLYLRGNEAINYEQLGLAFKLFSAEVLFNRGLCSINLGNEADGMNDLQDARKEKSTPEHDVIDEAIKDRGEGYTVFSIPVGVLYRPPASKMKNVKQKDYLGKAQLIAATDERDAFTTFTGVTRLRQGQLPSGAPLNGSDVMVSRSSSDPGVGGVANTAIRKISPNPNTSRYEAPLVPTNTNTNGRDRSPPSANLARSQTQIVPGQYSGGMGGLPQRGQSVRRADSVAQNNNSREREREREQAPRVPVKLAADTEEEKERAYANGGGGSRVTELYDYYSTPALNSAPALPPISSVESWALKSRGAAAPPPQSLSPNVQPLSLSRTTTASSSSVTTPPESYSQGRSAPPSSFGGRAPVRRPSAAMKGGRMNGSQRSGSISGQGGYARRSGYGGVEEEEEGYGSGEGEEDYQVFEMTKVRLKIHFQNDIRGLSLTSDSDYDEFMAKIRAKFGMRGAEDMKIQFRDEDGSMISLADEDDFESAIDVARHTANGKSEGKLEVWINGG
ncbi:hypothetical protein BDY24DRAFT_388793 [Mrakia frigida]|uniref:uncharacterized protein n=1 Tax=Mrakia frigida TaxID=29902 RepID=UPI003FCC02DE